METMARFIFLGSKITADSDCSLEIKTLAPWKESYDKPRQYIKKQRHHFANKVCIFKAMVFPAVMYGCESWTIKKAEHQITDAFKLWCWRRFLKSPLDCKEINPVNPKENQPWLFIGKTDAEAESPILWSKSQVIGKDPNAGEDWGQEDKRVTEDEMVGWHHQLNGH